MSTQRRTRPAINAHSIRIEHELEVMSLESEAFAAVLAAMQKTQSSHAKLPGKGHKN